MAEIASTSPVATTPAAPPYLLRFIAPLLALAAAFAALSFGAYPVSTGEMVHFLGALAGLVSMEPDR